MQIKLKNKRGKDIAILKWERPEDIIHWAESIKDSNGFEFRNVVPETPIVLQGEAAPVHKLKVVSANTLTSHSDIQTAILSVIDNLNEEFEALMCKSFVNENQLSDKKNQINVLNSVLDVINKMNELKKVRDSLWKEMLNSKIQIQLRKTDKPLFAFNKLKELATKNPGIIKQH